jgi:hypothetical protein
MAFKLFRNRTGGDLSAIPLVTTWESGLQLNAAAAKILSPQGKCRFVNLFFDEEGRRIGIKGSGPGRNTFRIRLYGRGGGMRITCTAFLRCASAASGSSYRTKLDAGMLVINLLKPADLEQDELSLLSSLLESQGHQDHAEVNALADSRSSPG